ncbi:unnamed protein product [Nesidiocoris tenuis]|uniref:Uncharacterized protein n=1 Tax=Nesidiocoris tenuis TaxID=355587 RepID=A0A6H5HWH7_9HEMI|nr:unnamed protein product [Nesidiocoris tenuis]
MFRCIDFEKIIRRRNDRIMQIRNERLRSITYETFSTNLNLKTVDVIFSGFARFSGQVRILVSSRCSSSCRAMQSPCGWCSAVATVFRRLMCIAPSRRGSHETYYSEQIRIEIFNSLNKPLSFKCYAPKNDFSVPCPNQVPSHALIDNVMWPWDRRLKSSPNIIKLCQKFTYRNMGAICVIYPTGLKLVLKMCNKKTKSKLCKPALPSISSGIGVWFSKNSKNILSSRDHHQNRLSLFYRMQKFGSSCRLKLTFPSLARTPFAYSSFCSHLCHHLRIFWTMAPLIASSGGGHPISLLLQTPPFLQTLPPLLLQTLPPPSDNFPSPQPLLARYCHHSSHNGLFR